MAAQIIGAKDMKFTVKSHVERLDQTSQGVLPKGAADNLAQVEKWVREKGYFSRELIDKEIDLRLPSQYPLPDDGKIARATFDRIRENGSDRISLDKFVAEFDNVLDTKLPYVRDALEAVCNMLLFFSRFPFESASGAGTEEKIELAGFLRALRCHIKLNPFCNTPDPCPTNTVWDGHEGYGVHNYPFKTSSDLRRLFFRSIASPVTKGGNPGSSPTYVPVLQFIWHEHTADADGKPVCVEHRVFEQEDERTVELQDILGMARVKVTPLNRAISRPSYKTIVPNLPHSTASVQQLRINRKPLVSLAFLLSHIDPNQPGFKLLSELPRDLTEPKAWLACLPQDQPSVTYEHFNALLKEQLLSKLIGLLAAKRSADGLYEGQEIDRESVSFPAPDPAQFNLTYLTAADYSGHNKLEDDFVVNTTNAERPLQPCQTCWELELVEEDY